MRLNTVYEVVKREGRTERMTQLINDAGLTSNYALDSDPLMISDSDLSAALEGRKKTLQGLLGRAPE